MIDGLEELHEGPSTDLGWDRKITDPKWAWHTIDSAIRNSIDRYFDEHLPVGGFLQAVFRNDLSGAVARADMYNTKTLPAITTYVYDNPEWWGRMQAVGSQKNYEDWTKEYKDGTNNSQRNDSGG